MLASGWLEKIASKGVACFFELDGDFLQSYTKVPGRYIPLSKFPSVYRDISLFVPLQETVAEFESIIKSVDDRIHAVQLIDFFHKKDWGDEKSLNFSFEIRDPQKT